RSSQASRASPASRRRLSRTLACRASWCRTCRTYRTATTTDVALTDDVSAAITEAMRRQDAPELGALRVMMAALLTRAGGEGRAFDEAESRQVVAGLVKQRRDSIEQFLKGGRKDLADKEAGEISILESYLPPAADATVIEGAVADAIAETGATSSKDMGRVMKAAMSRLAGQTVDGKAVNEIVRRKLGS